MCLHITAYCEPCSRCLVWLCCTHCLVCLCYSHCLLYLHCLACLYRLMYLHCLLGLYTLPGAVLEGFLRFPETTQDFPSTMGAPFLATTFYEAYTAGWIAVLTGLCFDSKLRKCSENPFLVATKENWRPSQNLCCSVTGNSARRSIISHRMCTHKSPRQTGSLETTQRNL